MISTSSGMLAQFFNSGTFTVDVTFGWWRGSSSPVRGSLPSSLFFRIWLIEGSMFPPKSLTAFFTSAFVAPKFKGLTSEPPGTINFQSLVSLPGVLGLSGVIMSPRIIRIIGSVTLATSLVAPDRVVSFQYSTVSSDGFSCLKSFRSLRISAMFCSAVLISAVRRSANSESTPSFLILDSLTVR